MNAKGMLATKNQINSLMYRLAHMPDSRELVWFRNDTQRLAIHLKAFHSKRKGYATFS